VLVVFQSTPAVPLKPAFHIVLPCDLHQADFFQFFLPSRPFFSSSCFFPGFRVFFLSLLPFFSLPLRLPFFPSRDFFFFFSPIDPSPPFRDTRHSVFFFVLETLFISFAFCPRLYSVSPPPRFIFTCPRLAIFFRSVPFSFLCSFPHVLYRLHKGHRFLFFRIFSPQIFPPPSLSPGLPIPAPFFPRQPPMHCLTPLLLYLYFALVDSAHVVYSPFLLHFLFPPFPFHFFFTQLFFLCPKLYCIFFAHLPPRSVFPPFLRTLFRSIRSIRRADFQSLPCYTFQPLALSSLLTHPYLLAFPSLRGFFLSSSWFTMLLSLLPPRLKSLSSSVCALGSLSTRSNCFISPT